MSSPFAGPNAPRLLAPGDAALEGASVWVFEGTLERVIGGVSRYALSQRVAWLRTPEWEEVRRFGTWMVERLSINGHVLIGLRAWEEGSPNRVRRIHESEAA